MKSHNLSTWFKLFLLASDAATSVVLVSSYTFDPLNNSWKPSNSRRGNSGRSHQYSSSASSYSYTPAEPTPSAGVEFTYNSDDIVSHHYTAFAGGNGDADVNDPAFVPKQTLVEIQYNKRTGEVSLLDEEGVVTPEEYQRLKKAIKFEEEGGDDSVDGITASEQKLQSQEREEDVAVGKTLYLDVEDLDPTDIIDTDSQELTVLDSDNSSPTSTHTQQEDGAYYYPQQLLDYPEPSVQWHQSEEVEPAEQFDSYSIPQQETDNNYPVQQHQQQYQHYQYSQQPMQAASAVAEPNAEQYYQQQIQQQAYAEYYPATAVAEQPAPVATEEVVEYDDEAHYRSSRGFGFAHRREFFSGSN